MPGPVYVSGAVEGPSDEAVLRRVIEHFGAEVHRVQVQHGKSNLRQRVAGYNNAARRSPWLVLVDLNGEYPCPGRLVSEWLPAPAQYMRLRAAVRRIEAWLMADAERFAQFFGVRRRDVPDQPETLANAKSAVVALTSASRKAAVRADMTPRPGSGRPVGPAYTSRIIEFARSQGGWRPDVAAQHAPSLDRCLKRLQHLIDNPPYKSDAP